MNFRGGTLKMGSSKSNLVCTLNFNFSFQVPRGDKVLTYSVIRLALVDAESGAIPGYNFAKLGPFRTKLREIKVDTELRRTTKYFLTIFNMQTS